MSEEAILLEPGILDGVSKGTIDKLKNAGITNVETLSRQTAKDLADKASMGEATAEKAIKLALKFTSSGYITGNQLRDQRETRTRLKTGVKLLDEILGGGIESETTTEISGASTSGKTQLCHMFSIYAQLSIEEGGLGGEVAWVDTEDTFRPERILEICENRGFDGEEFLKRIHHGHAKSAPHQKLLIEQLYDLSSKHNIKLIIVDSMIAHLRGEYLGRGNLSPRQNELGSMLQTLMKVAQSTKATVIYTNQVLSNPAQLYGDPEKPTGGNVMGHAATTRLHIRKGRENSRIIKLTKSPYLPEAQAAFLITNEGISDPE